MHACAILLAILLTATASVTAGAISIASPDHAETFAYGGMISRELYLNRSGGELAARITFSNLPYVDDNGPRRDESFDFRFPGVQFDSAHHAFFARALRGEPIAVARCRGNSAYGWIDLAPGREGLSTQRTRTCQRYPDRE
jgi:hypothetical protein